MSIIKKIIPSYRSSSGIFGKLTYLVDQSGRIASPQLGAHHFPELAQNELEFIEVPLSVWLNQLAPVNEFGYEDQCEYCDTQWHFCFSAAEPKIPVRLTHGLQGKSGIRKIGFASIWVAAEADDASALGSDQENSPRLLISLEAPNGLELIEVENQQRPNWEPKELVFDLYETFRENFETAYWYSRFLSGKEKNCDWCAKKSAHRCARQEDFPDRRSDEWLQSRKAFEESLSD